MRAAIPRVRANDDLKPARLHVDMEVGRQLSAIREARGFSRDYLAARTSIASDRLREHELGQTRITAGDLLVLSKVLRAPLSSFFARLA